MVQGRPNLSEGYFNAHTWPIIPYRGFVRDGRRLGWDCAQTAELLCQRIHADIMKAGPLKRVINLQSVLTSLLEANIIM